MSDLPHDPDCIFCKIVKGEIPSRKVFEDEHLFAFLDINPLSPGHTLIIPKAHYVTLDQVPADQAEAFGPALARIGRAVAKATDCDGWNVLQNNGEAAQQLVMHVHFHIIPRTTGDKLGYRWPAGELDDTTAGRLVDAIGRSLG